MIRPRWTCAMRMVVRGVLLHGAVVKISLGILIIITYRKIDVAKLSPKPFFFSPLNLIS